MKLKSKMLFSVISIIVFLGLFISFFGFLFVKKHIVDQAQRQISMDLKVARSVYEKPFELMRVGFDMYRTDQSLGMIKANVDLDYLVLLDQSGLGQLTGNIARKAYRTKQACFGTRVMGHQELEALGSLDASPYVIALKATPEARPTDQTIVKDVMVLEYAKPLLDANGVVRQLLYGGRILTRNYPFVDDIVKVVFENRIYNNKPVGTVTIFQDDVRIATNVLDDQGQRAIGTRVSDIVYEKVVDQGEVWNDRAFVVTDWYLTAYEPIRNIDGNILGILYVGILEQPYHDTQRSIFLAFISLIAVASLIAAGLAVWISDRISNPISSLMQTIRKIGAGDLKSKVEKRTEIDEFNELIIALNDMSDRLSEREKNVADSRNAMAEMNKRYLDLIGFVSHELKGLLSSIVLNTYLLQQGILGPVNAKQKKILQSIARNLDYLTVTVRNFLNLSRVEKAELVLSRTDLLLKEHVFDVSTEAFMHQALDKELKVTNNIDPSIEINGDAGLLQIVVNNLLSNAVKYARSGGCIQITSRVIEGEVEVTVYNDGTPIASVDLDKLFKKFSRIVYRGQEKVKGTGIGLFITKEIIERHGGRIWVEPQAEGNAFKFRIKMK